MKATCALCLVTLFAASPALAQTPRAPEPFRAETEAVEIDVRVVDENGRLVHGLTTGDFELFEDGVRQQLRVVTPVNVPTLPRPRSAILPEPDTQSNRVPFDGRVYAIVLDDLHIHPLRANRVKAVLRQFIDRHFAANDRAAVVSTSGRGAAMQELTGSPASILRAVDALQGRGLRSAVVERINMYYNLRPMRELDTDEDDSGSSSSRTQQQPIADPLEFERVYQARQTLTSLRDVARWLESVPARRKALIFVSEGIEYDLRNFVENRFASGLLGDLQDAIAGAARSSTSIYAIDPRGLGGMEDEKIELSSLPDDTTDLGSSAFANALRVTQDNLQVLAEQTGGFALVNTNALNEGFERLVRDNSEYYVLGYESTNPKRDGRFRKVQVKVNRPGLRVVARRGYYARSDAPKKGSPATTTPLKALLDSPLPVTGIPIDSHVAVFRGGDKAGSALVTVELGPGIGFEQEGDINKGRVDIAVVAIDQDGKIAAMDDRGLNLNLRPQTRARADEHGLRMTTRLLLKPGRYQVRIAAHDRTSGKGGSVLHDIEVPDYARQPLAISPILMASAHALLKATTNVDDELKGVINVPPTVSRTFSSRDEVTLFAEVYAERTKIKGPVTLLTVVADETGQVAFRSEEQLEPEAFEPTRNVFRHRAQIPVKDLAPGRYIVELKAELRREGGPAVTRQVPLQITAESPAQNATN